MAENESAQPTTPQAAGETPAVQVAGEGPPKRYRTLQALAGAFVLCLLIPGALLWVRNSGNLQWFGSGGAWKVRHLLVLLLTELVLIAPGLVILAVIFLALLRRSSVVREKEERRAIRWGTAGGALMSFLNFPGYLGLFHLDGDPHPRLRLCAIYIITGGVCGAWIGWQAFRERHPERGALPRYSLRTLLILAFAWGFLLWIFMPEANR
ncbi:MAG: hypothetical protein NTW87_33095 [Planctomycetota bacterium]|nr:hypothetical protein [Planctomycetota bacterium]